MSKSKKQWSTPLAFIPRQLIVAERDELEIFPLNVLFVSQANIDGIDTSGSALYEPDLSTYYLDRTSCRLRYYNKYSAQDYLDILWRAKTGCYEGRKYVSGGAFCAAYGDSWKGFFINLTAHGLSKDEGCEFKPL